MLQQIILASQSPRRAEILSWLDVDFIQRPADIDEYRHDNEGPAAYVLRLAEQKAQACATLYPDLAENRCVLGSDTTVAIGEYVFEKPVDEADMRRMLSALSGNTHQVFTAVAVKSGAKTQSICVSTQVTFRTISEQEMAFYWASQEPLGKAGGYGIQGLGGQFVSNLDGSYTAVMGLPIFETSALLTEAGIKMKGVSR